MNRKAIKEFSEQAKQHALNYMIKVKLTDKAQASRAYSEKYETKFAELLVKECFALVQENKVYYDYPEYSILDHFRVKK